MDMIRRGDANRDSPGGGAVGNASGTVAPRVSVLRGGSEVVVRVLGPVEAVVGGRVEELGPPKQRGLLVLLASQVGQPVAAEVLVDQLWAGASPPAAMTSLQTYVANLRRILEPQRAPRAAALVLRTHGSGYVLDRRGVEVDAQRFSEHATTGWQAWSRRDAQQALTQFEAGLALWRGPAYAEAADTTLVGPEIARLDQLRLSVVEGRGAALLALGAPEMAVAELEAHTHAHPLREHGCELLALGLYRTGRQADALAVLRTMRTRLAEELGIDPSSALQRLERDILTQAPELDWHPPPSLTTTPATTAATAVPEGLATGPVLGDDPDVSAMPDSPQVRPDEASAGRVWNVPARSAMSAGRTNLPSELTSFIGRRSELAQIGQLLSQARLLTLTGAGGCGKTRLALQAATEAIDGYPDGLWWVELARVEDPSLVPAAVISTLGLREAPGRPLVDTLVEYLQTRRVLLVLDNCEHLVAACAALADALLRACPWLTILATSRAPLRVPGEITWRVPSMSLPTEPACEPIESLRQSDAVSLFLDRARQVRPNFAITADNASAVAEICRDLDGIPLAIELAAARLRMMSPEQICRALSDRFRVLTGWARTVMPRQQTLQASLNWSYDLLDADERTLLRRLSVFAGGWTLEAAEKVCSGEDIARYAVLDLLTALIDKSLVTTEDHGPETRYRLLETVRQYTTVRLADAGEHDQLRQRHLTYYLELAERAEPQLLRAGPDNPILHILAIELPNLRAALDWAITTDPIAGLRLMNALTMFWLRGRYQEGEAAYAHALDAAGEEPTLLRGRVLVGRGYLGLLGNNKNALGWCQEALDLGQACDDAWTQGRALGALGFAIFCRGHPASARPLLQRSVEQATEAGDDVCRIHATQHLADAWMAQGEFNSARPLLEDAYASATRVGYQGGIASHWYYLGREAIMQGRLKQARELFERAVTSCDEAGDVVTSGMANDFLSQIHLLRGETDHAYALASATLRRMQQVGARIVLGIAQQMLGRTELAMGELVAAREHLYNAVQIDRHGTLYSLCKALTSLGTLERVEGKLQAAYDHGKQALDSAQRIGSESMQAEALRLLARLALAAGNASDAERYARDALARLKIKGLALGIPECLDILAAAAAVQKNFDQAARLLGSAAAHRQRLGIVRFPPEPEFWASVERTTRDALGGDRYYNAYTEGDRGSL